MVDQPVSQMTVVSYKAGLLIPAIDPTAPVGLKNVAIEASALAEPAQDTSSGGGAFLSTPKLITQQTTIPAGSNGLMVGPVKIELGASIQIPPTSSLRIL